MQYIQALIVLVAVATITAGAAIVTVWLAKEIQDLIGDGR